MIRHGGKLDYIDEGNLLYQGGEMCVWEGIPRDEYNKFDLENMAKCHGYVNFEKIWWRNPQVEGPEIFQLREVLTDVDILSMTSVSVSNNGEIELFFEHPVLNYELPPISHSVQNPEVNETTNDENADDEHEVSVELIEVVDGVLMVHESVDVTYMGKAKVGGKGKSKAKDGGKGHGNAKVFPKAKDKAAVESGTKRSRKQAKLIKSSETESNYEIHGGMS